MGKEEGTVAPRERVNITYKPATGGAKAEVELPFKVTVLGDFTLRKEDTPLEERSVVSVDKDNFSDVMKKQNLSLQVSVADKLSGKEDAEMPVNLKFDNLSDFTPDRIAEQVPELNKLLELRKALQALKGPLGNLPGFQKKLKGIMDSEAEVEKLLKELGGEGEGAKGEGA
jgi:type VI secretion system protein ImpB